jgi:hypothetical protein
VLDENQMKTRTGPIWRIRAGDRPEVRAIVRQRLRHAIDSCLVFLEQLNVSLSPWAYTRRAHRHRRDEEMLDHAVRTQQLDAIQKQLWIRRNALTDGAANSSLF